MKMNIIIIASLLLTFGMLFADPVNGETSKKTITVTDKTYFTIQVKGDSTIEWSWSSTQKISFGISSSDNTWLVIMNDATSDTGSVYVPDTGTYSVVFEVPRWGYATVTYSITYSSLAEDDGSIDICCGGFIVIPLLLLGTMLYLKKSIILVPR